MSVIYLYCVSVIVLFVVLQADNGGEFHCAAYSAKDNGGEFHCAAYSAKEDANVTVGEIIQELAQLWPGYRMVKGAPYHSATNGGVERFNKPNQTLAATVLLYLSVQRGVYPSLTEKILSVSSSM